MKKTRKLLALLLVACLIASFAPMSFADDPVQEEGDPAPAAEGGEATVTITQDGEKTTMEAEAEGATVYVDPEGAEGSLESVNVDISFVDSATEGKITAFTSDDNTYASVQSPGDIQLDIKVEGDVGTAETAETPASGITLTNYSFSDGEGASATTNEVSIYADGNVYSNTPSGGTYGPTANGIEAKSEVVYYSKDTIISNVTAEGNVSASAGIPGVVMYVNGVNASADNSGTGSAVTNVVVNGADGILAAGGIATGVYASADTYPSSGNASTTVEVTGIGGVVAESDNDIATGIYTNVTDHSNPYSSNKESASGTSSVNVKVTTGGVTAAGASADGVNIYTEGGNAEVFVNQYVDAQAKAENGDACGVVVHAFGDNSVVNLDVGGIVAEAEGTDDSVSAHGADLNAYGGATINATVAENGITAIGGAEGRNYGADLVVYDNAAVNLTVLGEKGNVYAQDNGIILGNYNPDQKKETESAPEGSESSPAPAEAETTEYNPGSINVFVEGEVSANQNSFLLTDSTLTSENVAITVWSASSNKDGQIVGIQETGNKSEDAALNQHAGDIESNIRYIIKIGDSGKEYDNLEIGGAAVKDDSTHGYYVARAYDETEATIVSLKAVEGYQLVGVVHDEKDHTIRQDIIVQDTDGNYLLLIPHGGGLWISVSLEKIPEPSDDSSSYEFVLMALGRIIAKDGSVLTIYNNRTYTVAYADGSNDNGTWKVADSLLVFTSSAGEEIAPELNADGDAVYTFKAGTEFVISPDIVNAVQSYRMF